MRLSKKSYNKDREKNIIASNRQGAGIIDFTQGEKYSIPVGRESLKKISVENFRQLNIFISPPNDKIISYIALYS